MNHSMYSPKGPTTFQAAVQNVTGNNGFFMNSTLSTTQESINLKSGDVIQLVTNPYYISTAVSAGSALIQVTVQSLAAGWSANLEFSSAFVRAVPSPYA